MGIGQYVLHIAAVSGLMVLGKMFPVFCYRSEADIFTRLALSFGMCPRGEVGAGVIVISLALGVKGNVVPVAVCCLALNIAVSGLFIMAATKLVNKSNPKLRRRQSHLFD
jgi:Kef-type K+ transport system membrane component KefB